MKQYIDDYRNKGLRTDNGVIKVVTITGRSKARNPSGKFVRISNHSGKSLSISAEVLTEVIEMLDKQNKLIHIGGDL